MPHEILRCSCGAIIRRCRCAGPHPVTVVDRGCPACQAAPAADPAATVVEVTGTYRGLPFVVTTAG